MQLLVDACAQAEQGKCEMHWRGRMYSGPPALAAVASGSRGMQQMRANVPCRDHVVADLLGCIYAMLRGDFLRACSDLYAHAAAWQEREVALYALR